MIRLMRKRDSLDVLMSGIAVILDGIAVFGGFVAATWFRFDSGLIPLRHPRPLPLYPLYLTGAGVAAVLILFVFRSLDLFTRPQVGSFVNKIPRLFKACTIGIVLTTVLAFGVQNEADFSRITIALSWFTATFLVLLERYLMFRIEWNVARHSNRKNDVLILGTGAVASHLKRTLKREPMLRSRVVGFLRADLNEADPGIGPEEIKGTIEELRRMVEEKPPDQIILTNASMGSERILEILLLCERNLIDFKMVPDLFHLMTSSMDVQSLDDIPLLGVRRWPLDHFWNRLVKRGIDIVGATVGLVISAPVVALAAVFIKRDSPGPVFYSQERCGEKGQRFLFYKLRTMPVDSEKDTGPVFTSPHDCRRTPVGVFLRRHNLDELPQLWNVLKGDMSLVGPRPERPHFVEQFKTDIARYMWRHVSKPGMTGWAQVNGLRGDTSIGERIKYDLYYLENWSLAFDFKILLKTMFARENAY